MSKDSRASRDIVDQSSERLDPVGPETTSSSSSKFVIHYAHAWPDRPHHSPSSDSRQVEVRPNRKIPLSVDLTGYTLLNIASIVVFGIWKVVLSDHRELVAVTRVEFSLLMFSALMYAFHSRAGVEEARLRRADGLSDYSTSSCSETNIRISVTVSSKPI